jgi:hypothetical protein
VELSCKNEYALLALIELAANYATGEPMLPNKIFPIAIWNNYWPHFGGVAWCDRSGEPEGDMSYLVNPGKLTC